MLLGTGWKAGTKLVFYLNSIATDSVHVVKAVLVTGAIPGIWYQYRRIPRKFSSLGMVQELVPENLVLKKVPSKFDTEKSTETGIGLIW